MPDHNLWRIVDCVSRAVPDRHAIVWRRVGRTYAELADRAARLANVLRANGLGVRRERAEIEPWEAGQDLFGCYLMNGPEYLEATLAGYGAPRPGTTQPTRRPVEELTLHLPTRAPSAFTR